MLPKLLVLVDMVVSLVHLYSKYFTKNCYIRISYISSNYFMLIIIYSNNLLCFTLYCYYVISLLIQVINFLCVCVILKSMIYMLLYYVNITHHIFREPTFYFQISYHIMMVIIFVGAA